MLFTLGAAVIYIVILYIDIIKHVKLLTWSLTSSVLIAGVSQEVTGHQASDSVNFRHIEAIIIHFPVHMYDLPRLEAQLSLEPRRLLWFKVVYLWKNRKQKVRKRQVKGASGCS